MQQVTNVSDIKKRYAAKEEEKQSTALMIKQLDNQLSKMQNYMRDQSLGLRKVSQDLHQQSGYLERIHDRLDSLVTETRVSNMLMSELVALHQTVVTGDTDDLREAIRQDVYQRIRNGE